MKEEAVFDQARKMYPGVKRGLQPEYQNFRKKYCMHIAGIIPLLIPAIEERIAFNESCRKKNMWFPGWPYFQTWINQQRWTDELPQAIKPKCHYCKQIKTPLKEVSVSGKTVLVKICESCLRSGRNRT